MNGCELAYPLVSNLLSILMEFLLPIYILPASLFTKFYLRKVNAHILSAWGYLCFHGFQEFWYSLTSAI